MTQIDIGAHRDCCHPSLGPVQLQREMLAVSTALPRFPLFRVARRHDKADER